MPLEAFFDRQPTIVAYLVNPCPISHRQAGGAWIAASLLAFAAAVAQDTAALPGGATSLREGHGDWAVSCNLATRNGAGVKVCALSQEQTDSQSRQRVLAMELRLAGEAVQGTLVLPFVLALDQ